MEETPALGKKNGANACIVQKKLYLCIAVQEGSR